MITGLATVATSGKYADLDGLPTIPAAYTHPTHTAKTSGLYKITVDALGHVSGATAVTKADITDLGIPAQDTTYSLSSFGITATADELNYTDGVTSNIQTQLNAKAGTTSVYTATIGTTWSGSGPYTQTVTVTGITADDTPIVDLVPSTTQATAITQMGEYQKIFKITTAANSITVYATSKTTSNLSIQLRPLR